MAIRVANITDFSVEVRNSENDPHFSRFLYGVLKFSYFLRILQFFDFDMKRLQNQNIGYQVRKPVRNEKYNGSRMGSDRVVRKGQGDA